MLTILSFADAISPKSEIENWKFEN
jgi:hypothetical protein